jgi:cytochrome c nitrite reductase small subunit
VMVGLFVLVGGGMAYTSRGDFCAKCHEIRPYVTSWKKFSHKSVACLDCHANPGNIGYLIRKVRAYSEVYNHVTGNYDPKNIQTKFNQQNCIKCHNGSEKYPNAKNIYGKEDTERFYMNHELHLEEDLTCLDCHKIIVHGNNPLQPEKNTVDYGHRTATCTKCHDINVKGDDPQKWKWEESCENGHKYDPRKRGEDR